MKKTIKENGITKWFVCSVTVGVCVSVVKGSEAVCVSVCNGCQGLWVRSICSDSISSGHQSVWAPSGYWSHGRRGLRSRPVVVIITLTECTVPAKTSPHHL